MAEDFELDNVEMEHDVITLVDEENVPHEFEILDALEVDDHEYFALTPIYDDPADSLNDDGELVILRVAEDSEDDGDQFLEIIEDDDEYDKVSALFMERLEDYFDFEDDEDEEETSDDK